MPIDFRKPWYFKEFRFCAGLVWAGILKTITGTSPLSLTKALAKNIVSLTQYGKCEQDGVPTSANPIDIKCNNGTLKWDSVNQCIYADGTSEVLTVSGANLLNPSTASAEDLLAIGDIKDEQDIINGTVKRRCEAVLYDGVQTIAEPYMSTTGGKDNGAIIIQPKGINYTDATVEFDLSGGKEVGEVVIHLNDAKQNLNGYSKPWPAGGGDNKFLPSATSEFGSAVGGYQGTNIMYKRKYPGCRGSWDPTTETFSYSGKMYSTSIKSAILLTIPFTNGSSIAPNMQSGETWYIYADVSPHSYFSILYNNTSDTTGYFFTTSAYSGWQYIRKAITIPNDFVSIKSVSYGFNNGSTYYQSPSGSVKLGIMSSMPTEWTPCKNVCTILGESYGHVYNAGKNLLYDFTSRVTSYGIKQTAREDTSIALSGTATSTFIDSGSAIWDSLFIKNLRGKVATFSCKNANEAIYYRLGVSNGSTTTYYDTRDGAQTFTFPQDCIKTSLNLTILKGTNTNGVILYPQLELGEEATEFYPRQHTDLMYFNGETVYGGKLYPRVGKIIRTHLCQTFTGKQEENWIAVDGYVNRFKIQVSENTGDYTTFLSNYLVSTENGIDNYTFGLHSNGDLYVTLDNTITQMTVTDFKSYLSSHHLQIYYKLATETYFTRAADDMKFYNGINFISSGAGTSEVLILEPTIENVTPQSITTSKGMNTVSVTAEVSDINFDIKYIASE